MLLRTDVQNDFLNLFSKIIENEPLENENRLNLFVLKITNNSFSYETLTEELGNILTTYALSRSTYDELCSQKKYASLVIKAKEKLRKAENNDGELGEILLYCMLESHLNAPKLLTKLELKTAANNYVNGADGVHLLKIDDSTYQFVFGESKLNSSLQTGIYEAFKSINNLLEKDLNNLRYEISLVNSNILKETATGESTILKKLLIPTENDENLNIDHSFGIFLGFDIPISNEERKMKNSDFRTLMNGKIEKAVRDVLTTLNNQIKKNEFVGYNFYIYIIPFSELDVVRKKIIEKLKTM